MCVSSERKTVFEKEKMKTKNQKKKKKDYIKKLIKTKIKVQKEMIEGPRKKEKCDMKN